jgi:hypothetical protein
MKVPDARDDVAVGNDDAAGMLRRTGMETPE